MSNESNDSTSETLTSSIMSQSESTSLITVFTTSLPGTMQSIFLQTPVAQAIAGVFAFAAILVTCHHVS